MAVIKAADILAQVTRAKARVTHMDEYFAREVQNDLDHSVEERLNLSLAWSIQLSAIRSDLEDYVRSLPVAVRNKQAKACAQAKAYAEHIEAVHVPACRNWIRSRD